MAEKRKFSDGKTFGRPKFRTEKFSDKKKSESFSVRKFSFLMYLYIQFLIFCFSFEYHQQHKWQLYSIREWFSIYISNLKQL